MSEPLTCPTCGESLDVVRQEQDRATGEQAWVWSCRNAHWWRQTARFGWLPTAPDAETIPDLVPLEEMP